MQDAPSKFTQTKLFPIKESLHEIRVGICVDRALLKMDTPNATCPDAGTRCFCSICSLYADDKSTH